MFGIEPTKSVTLNSAFLVQMPGDISRRTIVYVLENIVPITVDTTQPLFRLSTARIKTTAIARLSLPSQWTNHFLNQNTSNVERRCENSEKYNVFVSKRFSQTLDRKKTR